MIYINHYITNKVSKFTSYALKRIIFSQLLYIIVTKYNQFVERNLMILKLIIRHFVLKWNIFKYWSSLFYWFWIKNVYILSLILKSYNANLCSNISYITPHLRCHTQIINLRVSTNFTYTNKHFLAYCFRNGIVVHESFALAYM